MLNIENLYVSYGRIEALRGVSIKVNDGQIVSIVGSNGAGKSTLLRAISAIVRKKSGQISFDGVPLSSLPHKVVARGVIHVPEGRRIFPQLTVLENLKTGAYLNKNSKEVQKLFEEQFELFPILRQRAKQYGGTLSGGEQQMLAIARGLMQKPKLLLLDEPSLGLAPLIVNQIFEVIQRIRSMGVTVLLVEQNANKSLAISDYAYVLQNGIVCMEGTGTELIKNPEVAASYLGVASQGEGKCDI